MNLLGIFGGKNPLDDLRNIHDDLSETKDKLLKMSKSDNGIWDLVDSVHSSQGKTIDAMKARANGVKKP